MFLKAIRFNGALKLQMHKVLIKENSLIPCYNLSTRELFLTHLLSRDKLNYECSFPPLQQSTLLWRDEKNRGWQDKTSYFWQLLHRPMYGLIRSVSSQKVTWCSGIKGVN